MKRYKYQCDTCMNKTDLVIKMDETTERHICTLCIAREIIKLLKKERDRKQMMFGCPLEYNQDVRVYFQYVDFRLQRIDKPIAVERNRSHASTIAFVARSIINDQYFVAYRIIPDLYFVENLADEIGSILSEWFPMNHYHMSLVPDNFPSSSSDLFHLLPDNTAKEGDSEK